MSTKEAHLAARKALMEREKEASRLLDAIAEERRQLPKIPLDNADAYVFDTAKGKKTLAELFNGKSQLAVYHMMMDADADEACSSCSFFIDSLNGNTAHLAARDAALVVIARAPIGKVDRFAARMRWYDLTFASSGGCTFNEDFGVTITPDADGAATYNYGPTKMTGEAPGMSFFEKSEDGTISHTYSTYARGLDAINAAYAVMDRLPKGRNEKGLGFTMAWIKRHDKYEGHTQYSSPVVPEIQSPAANKHIEWIATALGGKVNEVHHADPAKQVVMHGHVLIDGCDLYVADAAAMSFDPTKPGGADVKPGSGVPPKDDPRTVSIHLNISNPNEVFASAVQHGAKPVLPMEDAFWGMRYGRFVDPFGTEWGVCGHIIKDEPASPAAKRARK